MENIKFKVEGMSIQLIDMPKVLTLNWSLKAEFEFSKDWEGTKTAIFTVNGESFAMVLEEDNTCLIPEECYNAKNMTFSVGCVSEKFTTNKINVKFVESCYVQNTTISNPTEDVYIQIIEKINSIDSGEVSQAEFDGVKGIVSNNTASIEALENDIQEIQEINDINEVKIQEIQTSVENNENAIVDLQTTVNENSEKIEGLSTELSQVNNVLENRVDTIMCETSKSLKVVKTIPQSLVANTSTLLTWQSIISKDDLNDIFVINPSNQSLVVIKDVKRIEILIQLTAQTITDIVGIYWYVQLKHVSGDNDVEVTEYSAKSNNYYQSKFIIDNVSIGDEIFFETSSNKALNIMNDSKFTSVKFVVYYDKEYKL